jgi:hypothetical protein
MQLKLINHNEIDYKKWDATLEQCHNKNIYATSVYLNKLAPNWKAIVSENWEYIMPIPFKRKFLLPYIPSIPFIQQLGIFSGLQISSLIIEQVLQILKNNFFIVDYNFNSSNNFNGGNKSNNFLKELNKPYDSLFISFSNDLKKDLNKKTNLQIEKNNNYKKAIDLFYQTYSDRITNLNTTNKNHLLQLCDQLHIQQNAFCYEAINHQETVAIALFFLHNNRIYNIASTITPEGKKLSANHFMYNQLIKDYANKSFILDFEGSDVSGIANFYKQFGCVNEPYFQFQYKKWRK